MNKLLKKNGFNEDKYNDKLERIIDNGLKIRKIFVEIRSKDDDTQLLGSIEESKFVIDTTVYKGNKRLLIYRKNVARTMMCNIIIDDIENCIYKEEDDWIEFIFDFHGIKYDMLCFMLKD